MGLQMGPGTKEGGSHGSALPSALPQGWERRGTAHMPLCTSGTAHKEPAQGAERGRRALTCPT